MDNQESDNLNLPLLRMDPQRYINQYSDYINENPQKWWGYFARQFGWIRVGQLEKALSDLDRAITLNDHKVIRWQRSIVLAQLSRHQEALQDIDRGQAMDSINTIGDFWHLRRATSHAGLGNEAAAVASAEKIRNDFWIPPLEGAPGGTKAEIIAELRRRAAAANKSGSVGG